MKILVDSSNYFLDNKNYGDIAMFCMLSRRLHARWPKAEISLITLDPRLVAEHVPGVRPLVLNERHHWQLCPPEEPARRPAWRWRRRLRRHRSPAAIRGEWPRFDRLAARHPDVERLVDAFRSVHLAMASGGGYFSDMFSAHACGILDTLAGAMHFGIPTAIIGAGFEEVRDRALCAKASAVLPRVDLVACREGLQAPRVLRGFGVSPRRIHVSGDDAVAIAHESRPARLGDSIGVNLRDAPYSGVTPDLLTTMAPVLARAADRHSAALLPIPISMFNPSDCESIRALMLEHDPRADGGATLDTLPQLLAQVGRCRLVVTGSYHAAVFALAQGVSVVALARSLHYVTKLGGLQAEFGDGCRVVSLDAPDLGAHLAAAIDAAWAAAEAHRSTLLESARRQIERCDAVYRRLSRIHL